MESTWTFQFFIFKSTKKVRERGWIILTEYLSYREAMQYMGFKTQDTLRTYIKHGLPTVKVGNSKRISKSAIDKFMADHTVVVTQHK